MASTSSVSNNTPYLEVAARSNQDTFDFFKRQEEEQRENFLRMPIDGKMWMRLTDETFLAAHISARPNIEYFLAISVMARYLITLGEGELPEKLDSIPIAAIILASNFEGNEEDYPLKPADFGGWDGLTRAGIAKTASSILLRLDYRFSWITPYHFIDWYGLSFGDWYGDAKRNHCISLLILSQYSVAFLAFKPSLQAAAIIYLVRLLGGQKGWEGEIVTRSGYTERNMVGSTVIPGAVRTLINWCRTMARSDEYKTLYVLEAFSKHSSTLRSIMEYYQKF